MSIVAFVDSGTRTASVLHYAAWASSVLDEPLTIVVQEHVREPEPALGFDAYQQMDARDDLFREFTSATREQPVLPESDSSAIELAQEAARTAKALGVQRVRTATTSDPLSAYIEHATTSGDFVIVARGSTSTATSADGLDEILHVRKRVILLVPEAFTPIESWLLAIDGSPATGRVVEFLANRKLLVDKSGTAVIVGGDHSQRVHFRDAVRHLESTDHEVTAYELRGAADDVLDALLTVLPIDLLVMGAYGQGRFRSLVERSTTARLLKSFSGSVLVSRA